jgi:hypothetical protein
MTGRIVDRHHRMRAALLSLAVMAMPAAAQTPVAAGAGALAPYFTPATGAPIAPDSDGFLRRWLLLEPIEKPNRTNTVFTASYVRAALDQPAFATAIPRDGQVVKTPAPLRWHALDSTRFDVRLFDFAKALGRPTYGVIFRAVAIVYAPREMRDVRLSVGSNAASLWWLNGREAVELFNDRRMVADDVVSDRLTLRKGRNVLRGAVINGPGLSDFCVRFLDAGGRPITELTTDVR